jgi:hypothetical protein
VPPQPNPFQAAGARPSAEPKGAPLWNDRFFTGLYTQRNVIRDPSGVVQERWYGGRPDALLDGLNVELTNRLTWVRAPGSTKFSTASLPQNARSFYSFKQFTGASETITVMADTPAALYSINPTSKTTVLTKAVGAGDSFLIGVNNTLYIGDGVEQMAWPGTGAPRNWGIAIGTIAGSSVSGYAGTGTDGGLTWTNPGNIVGAPSGLYATVALSAYGSSSPLLAATYGYAIGAGNSILGIGAAVRCHVSTTSGLFPAQLFVFLTQGGTTVGSAKVVVPGTGDVTFSLGGQGDLWGGTWSVPQVNGAGFGLWIVAQAGSVGVTFSVESAQTTIYPTGAPAVALVAGAFSPAPATGFQYAMQYGNNGKVYSQASPVTPVIKPDGTHSVQATLPPSLDAQVNQIWLMRTKDAGGVYYALPTNPYPNTGSSSLTAAANASGGSTVYTATAIVNPLLAVGQSFKVAGFTNAANNGVFPCTAATATTVTLTNAGGVAETHAATLFLVETDSAADSTLSLLQLADLNGLNTPPPAGFSAMEFHLGRIWGAVGNTVYYSVGSDLGVILGNGYEGFPPANFFTFPSKATRLLSVTTAYGMGLLVFTTSDVYVILGNGTALSVLNGATGITVFYAAPLLKGIGLASYNALVPRGGMVYLLTNDGRMISFNPAAQIIYQDPEKSINEIGFAIGDSPPSTSITLLGGTLGSFNPANAYVTWHGSGSGDQALYVADGATGWFRCNPNQQPDGGVVWSAKRTIVGGCAAVQSIETSPGVYQLLIGPTASSQLGTPRIVSAVAAGGGSLPAATYYFKVTAIDGSSGETLPSVEASAIVGASGLVTLNYVVDYRAASVRIYFSTTPGGEVNYFTSSNLSTFTLSTTSGQLSGSPPGSNGTAITGGFVLYRDRTVWSDSGTAYASCKARIGANVLAHPGQTANVDFITCDFAAQGSQPTVQVLFDELDAAFTTLSAAVNDPPQLATPSSVFSNRYYTRQATTGTQAPAACRFMQLWVDFGSSDAVQNELLSLCPFGSYEQEN